MFVISQSQSYFWPVSVKIPMSGGKYDKQTFDAEFKRLPQSRIKELGKAIERGETSDLDICKEILMGWKGVQDGKGEEVPFSEGARDQLLDVPAVASALTSAFMESLIGGKPKN